MAVKAADDVIVIDRCGRRQRNLAYGESFPDGWKTVHKHVLEQGDGLTKGLKIYEHDDGKKYTVNLIYTTVCFRGLALSLDIVWCGNCFLVPAFCINLFAHSFTCSNC